MKTIKRIEKLLHDFQESGLQDTFQATTKCCTNCNVEGQENKMQNFQHSDNIERMEESCNNFMMNSSEFKDENEEWKMLIKALQELPLQNFDVVKPLYDDLLQIPENQRKSQDFVLTLLLQKILEFNKQLVVVSKREQESTRIWNAALSTSNEEIQRLTNDMHLKTSSHECDKRVLEGRISCLTTQLQQTLSEEDKFCHQVQQLSHELIEEKEHASHRLQQLQLHSPLDAHKLRPEVEKWTTEICESSVNTRYIEKYVQCDVEQLNYSSNQNSKFKLKNRLDDILCSLQRLPSIDTNDCQTLSEEIKRLSTTSSVQNNLTDNLYETVSKHCHGLHQNHQTKIITSCSEQHVSFYLQHLSQEVQKLFTTIILENDLLQSKICKLHETIQLEKQNVQGIKKTFQNVLQITLGTLAAQRRELEIQLNEFTKKSLENNSLNNENVNLTNELTKTSVENKSLQQELERTTNDFTRVHTEKCLLEIEVQRITIELKRIISDKDLLQSEVESLKKDLINISSKKDVSELEVERVTNEMPKNYLVEKDIMQYEVEKLKKDLDNEKLNSRNIKQVFQEELQDVINTWVIRKQEFESQVKKLLEDVAKISLEKNLLQHDFDKFKLITKCEREKLQTDSILLSNNQNNKPQIFCAREQISTRPFKSTKEGLQPLKIPIRVETKTNVIDEPLELKESPCMLECESKEEIGEGSKPFITNAPTKKLDMQQQLEKVSNENSRLKLREQQVFKSHACIIYIQKLWSLLFKIESISENNYLFNKKQACEEHINVPKKFNSKVQKFKQNMSHTLCDINLNNTIKKKPQLYHDQVLHYKKKTQNEIDRIKWVASKLAHEEMKLEDSQQIFK